MISFSDAIIIVMYKVKNCPNMVKAVFLRKTRFYEPNDKLAAVKYY